MCYTHAFLIRFGLWFFSKSFSSGKSPVLVGMIPSLLTSFLCSDQASSGDQSIGNPSLTLLISVHSVVFVLQSIQSAPHVH